MSFKKRFTFAIISLIGPFLPLLAYSQTPRGAQYLQKRKILLGSWSEDQKKFTSKPIELTVEIAQKSVEVKTGLMFRDQLGEMSGMLFLFRFPSKQSFWMKNTFVPLDAGFFDQKKILLNVEQMIPVRSRSEEPKKTYSSKGLAQSVLEMNQGWFERHQIKPGMSFRFSDEMK